MSAPRPQLPTECITEEVVAALHRELAQRWADVDDSLGRVHRYALLPPGKLIRPLLMIWSALAAGGELDHVLPAAAGFEAAHTGSLIHDDII
ncbi:polyprenyl synthetase family protein, partial [Actinomadura adrarensis]